LDLTATLRYSSSMRAMFSSSRPVGRQYSIRIWKAPQPSASESDAHPHLQRSLWAYQYSIPLFARQVATHPAPWDRISVKTQCLKVGPANPACLPFRYGWSIGTLQRWNIGTPQPKKRTSGPD
jgi:hypothetical protein